MEAPDSDGVLNRRALLRGLGAGSALAVVPSVASARGPGNGRGRGKGSDGATGSGNGPDGPDRPGQGPPGGEGGSPEDERGPENGGGPSSDRLADCLVTYAKYEWQGSGFALETDVSRGDTLGVRSGSPLVAITGVETDADGEPVAFTWDAAPYHVSELVVKYGPETTRITYDPPRTSAAVDLRAERYAISNVVFGKPVYLQVDVIMGTDFEQPPYLGDEPDDAIVSAAITNSCYGRRCGGTSPYDRYDFEAPFGGALHAHGSSAFGVDEGVVRFGFEASGSDSTLTSSDPGVSESADGSLSATVSLALYERVGPAACADGDGTVPSYDALNVPTQRLLDADSVTFPLDDGVAARDGPGSETDPLTVTY